ncbi:MAG: ATP-grasp domain-containing protein [Coriobacteriaceae bacterium]|nr:ATP-grasp domain-containing protein [Coriobacteriaceae bacterium]
MNQKERRGTVVMLGGSRLQLPAIEAAQRLGFRVVCADYDPDAPGARVADAFSLTSTLDVDAVERLARGEGADFVITSTSDAPVRVAAVVSERLGLPTGISSESAVCATQKDAMRLRLAEHGVPMPEFRVCNTVEDFASALEHFGYDCIAKPADAAASRGVKLITPEDRSTPAGELFELFRGFSRKGTVMVEQRVTGREVSVEGMTVNGVTTILTITDKLTTEPPYFVELGHSEPSRLSEEAQEAIREVAKRTVEAIGIVTGPSHTEVMLTEAGPKVIEMAARLGGDFITSKLVPLSTGIDLVQGTVAAAFGLPFDFTPKSHCGAAIRFITADCAGALQAIDVPESVREAEGVEEVEIYLPLGGSIETPHSSNDRIGHVVCRGADADEAACRAELALGEIKVDVA